MLYIVPTPIGNLEDITLRAINVLKSVDIILAEDTRTSKVLLNHYLITTSLKPYHKDNEHKIVESIIHQLQQGTTMALISDAGTPSISDPGFLLVRACKQNNIAIECLPGATAFVPALVQSGFPSDAFVFEGFLPHKKGRQKKWLELQQESRTIILYESPYRIIKLLEEATQYLYENTQVSISREITKKFEEHISGTIDEVWNHFQEHQPKGEFVVLFYTPKK
ncbi:MAG: 16S rRNA (cytidine(1402)-2'-O)-methyltransferase [Chitinophagales bacterium]|nr:16S rRNA (cytidine(1402)-2'-O)-methyltransferase [Chitinophagales bacterium]